MKTLLALGALLGATLLLLHATENSAPPALATPVPAPALAPRPALADGLYAEFITARGTFTCELFFEKTPHTVTSFVGLAEGTLGPKPGTPFFKGLKFHRVVPGFVVQGGDPLGTGEGGPGYRFADEFAPGLRHDDVGILSMANGGPDTNGSQFFLTLKPVNRLNYLHSVFGRTVHRREVLPLIQQDDVITAVNILRVGPAAHAFRADQAAFDALAAAAKRYPQPQFDDPENLLPAEPPRARNFNFKLTNFARATGIKIYVRLFAKYEPATPGQRPGNLSGELSRELGLGDDGILAVYFADTDQWGLWIGDHHVTTFMGRTGTVREFTRDGTFHRAKQDFLAAAKAQAGLYTAEAVKAAPPDQPLTPAQKIKYQVDAVLDGLILKFEPGATGNGRTH
jgi:cyclophilin family peptidyl-prolyl cis-trans isomerase